MAAERPTAAYEHHELSRFLATRRTSDGALASMGGMGSNRGKWYISDEEYPKFLDLLHDYLFIKRGRCMNFVEQPRKHEPKPLMIDLDFRYSEDTSLTRSFDFDHIEHFVHLVVEGMNTFFGVSDYSELRFFVTLRPAPYSAEKGKRKDGVHILCPDIALSNEKQAVLRRWILGQDGVRKAFKDTGYVNADDDVYDESMTRKQGWLFYGESKPNIAPYLLAAVFKYEPGSDTWLDEDTNSYSSRDLMELLSVRYNIVPDENVVKEETADLYKAMLHKTSGGGGGPAASPAHGPAAGPAEGGAPDQPQENQVYEAIQLIYGAQGEKTDGERTMIRRFVLECLKDPWFEQYDKWIRVGWCLHNIEASEDMFNLWMEFSAKSGKSAGNNLAQLRHDWFYGMRKTGDGPRLTERSLRKWAREDNPDLYEEIIAEDIHEFIEQRVEPTHYHIANLMKKMYGNNYVASVNPKSTEWFKYDDELNMWKRLNQGLELKAKISYEVAGKINKTIGKLFSDISKCNEEGKAKMAETLLLKNKDLQKVQFQLYNSGFTESVMKMAAQQFCEEEFHNKLNANPFLFGCRNGILELRAKTEGDTQERVIFRQGRPEDYVSFLAGQNYPETEPINYVPYDPADPRQAELADFFAKLFPNPELRRYTLRLLASCLEGANREQCYYTFTGVGGNGKSKLVELMRLTLGDYQTSMQSTVLTRKRPESGAANPDIMATKCRRFIYMQEPDDKEPINTSRMKQFSGEDMVEARALYGDQEKFRIMGKIVMMCNRLPPVNSMDQGTWRRIRVIEFVSKFVPEDHPELLLKKANVFPRDPRLDEKLREWREPFLSLLVHLYETEYIPFGLNPTPEMVMRASNKYKESFDVYARFRTERIREATTPEEQLEFRANPVDSKRIRLIVNAWKKENRVDALSPVDVLTRLEDEFGQPEEGKYWSSFKIFGSDDEVAEWDRAHSADGGETASDSGRSGSTRH